MNFVRLGEVSDSVMGQAPPGKACNKEGTGTPFVKAGEFSDRFPVIREWTTDPLKHSKVGDVLICVVGATAGKINQGINCAIGRSVAAIRPDARRLNSDYLYYFMRQRTDEMRAKSQGLAQGVITRDMIAEIEIPLPPLEEQKRIAAILDQADELRRKRQRAIDRLNQLGQAIFIEMFGDTEDEVSISEYLDDIQSGKNLVGVSEDQGTGFRVLKISAVSRNGFRAGETKPLPSDYVPPPRHIVADGDLLFSRANTTELVGIPCIVEGVHEKVALPDKLWRLVPSPRKSVSAFLCHALLSQASRRQIEKMCSGTSGSMQNISIQKFKTIRVPRASLRDQIRFRDAIEVVSLAKRDFEAHRNRVDALFQVLQHQAFRGELTASSLKEAAA